MYIPMINCVRVIAAKKATTRFFLKVSAYKLFKKLATASVSPLQQGFTVLSATLVQGECT